MILEICTLLHLALWFLESFPCGPQSQLVAICSASIPTFPEIKRLYAAESPAKSKSKWSAHEIEDALTVEPRGRKTGQCLTEENDPTL